MRTVIITGASRGLGKAIKERLLDDCWTTSYFDYGQDALKRGDVSAKTEYKYQSTDFSRTSGYDLTDFWGVEHALDALKASIPDILILNAGVWKNNWRLNYEAPKELAEQMPKDKLVIFILSNAAYQSFGNDDYTTAKGGLLHYARRKQREGFLFSTISPGTINTGFWDGAETDNRIRGAMRPEVVAELVYQIIKAHEAGALVKELIVTPCG